MMENTSYMRNYPEEQSKNSQLRKTNIPSILAKTNKKYNRM